MKNYLCVALTNKAQRYFCYIIDGFVLFFTTIPLLNCCQFIPALIRFHLVFPPLLAVSMYRNIFEAYLKFMTDFCGHIQQVVNHLLKPPVY